MRRALDLAIQAQQCGEVPVGALMVKQGHLVAEAFNDPIGATDPTAHAEINVLRLAAKKVKNYRIVGDTTLYVTLEPCVMCMGAMVHARVERLVFGAYDLRTGSAGSVFSLANNENLNHKIHVTGGVLEEQCAELLKLFFRAKRKK